MTFLPSASVLASSIEIVTVPGAGFFWSPSCWWSACPSSTIEDSYDLILIPPSVIILCNVPATRALGPSEGKGHCFPFQCSKASDITGMPIIASSVPTIPSSASADALRIIIFSLVSSKERMNPSLADKCFVLPKALAACSRTRVSSSFFSRSNKAGIASPIISSLP